MIRNIHEEIQSNDKRLAILRGLDLTQTLFAVDFDGTCVFHDFPAVGKTVPGADLVLKTLTDAGARLILHTVRHDTDCEGANSLHVPNAKAYATHASLWFDENRIPLWALNCNPEQASWSKSPKSFAHLYIDDAAVGCPLVWNTGIHARPFVDWSSVLTLLIQHLNTLPQVKPIQ